MNKKDCFKIIQEKKIGYLATFDVTKTTPRVRAVDIGTVYDNEIYFSTFKNTGKVSELDKSKKVEIFLLYDEGQIRIMGHAETIQDLDIKSRFLDDNLTMKDMFDNAENSDFVLYKIVPEEIRYMDNNSSSYTYIEN